jgi:hypothetical protein
MTRDHAAISRPWIRLCLLAILLIALGLGTYRLGYQEISGDEAFGYFFSLQSPQDIVRATLALDEPHPVGSYYLEKAWIAAVGDSEFALRFQSTLWSVLAVALLYVLARQLGLGQRTSLLSAALLALSPYAVWHAQNARMYSMSLALTVASTWLAIEAIRRRRWGFWVAYVLVSWLCLQIHYYTVFLIVAQNVLVIGWTLAVARAPRRLIPWCASQLALGLLALPWFYLARQTLTGYGGNGDSPPLGSALVRSLSVFAVGESLPALVRTISGFLAALLVVVAILRLTLSRPSRWKMAAALVAYLGIPLLAIWAGAQSRPIFDERYIVSAAPAFYLLASIAVLGSGATSPQPRPAELSQAVPDTRQRAVPVMKSSAFLAAVLLLVAGLISLGNYYFSSAYSKTRGWRELATTLTRLSGGIPSAEARLIQNLPDPTLWYYYRGPVAHLVLPPAPSDVTGTDEEVARLVALPVRRVILSAQQADWWDGDGVAEAALSKNYAPLVSFPVGPASIHVYARPPIAIPSVGVAFANGVTVAAAAPDSRELTPAGLLVVHLLWQGSQDALTGAEEITLQVLDSAGALVAQTDQSFGAADMGGYPASYGILVPGELSPGSYRLIVAVYDRGRPESPRWSTTTGADHIDLGELYLP